jgi:hypothetical protein
MVHYSLIINIHDVYMYKTICTMYMHVVYTLERCVPVLAVVIRYTQPQALEKILNVVVRYRTCESGILSLASKAEPRGVPQFLSHVRFVSLLHCCTA